MIPGHVNSKVLLSWVILTILIGFSLLQAGVTGKIAGIVLDSETAEPLVGANVLLEGTNLGGTTDMNGEYYIINIPPGNFDVKFLYIGYQTVINKDVIVSVDLTTRVDAQLAPQVMESDEIVVVTAERTNIQKDQ